VPDLLRRPCVLTRTSFDYAVIRVVPRVERAEFLNAGVILFCLERRYLGARVHTDEPRLKVLWPDLDVDLVRSRLEAVSKVCSGAEDGGPLARLPIRQRFHWLVAPRSTMIQVSPVHTGICDEPEHCLQELFRQLVLS
ncbi:MAG TPA: DUF3037 domain-containing protein, partial [Bryobacteraceae bacterium]|nr:DUF3037 domain-containing protein [Bryobacteraceae bacterium]